MQQSASLAETLKNCYLMTNSEGREVYDEDGNLLFYHTENEVCVAVPNTEEVRRLYELPLDSPEIKDTIKRDDINRSNGLLHIPSGDTNRLVWIGQKNEHSMKATKMLIELFDSPKYQALMKNPNTIKLKVWEKIASELEEKGYKIGANPRDAGLRAFQKWRNMERTYWKFMKLSPDECGEDKRRKKPYFFDDLHVVMSKRSKSAVFGSSASCIGEDGREREKQDEDDDEDDDGRPEGDLKRRRVSDMNEADFEAFPRQALSLLTSLVTSPKYDELLKDNNCKSHQNRTKVWESIYTDMVKAGWKFGSSIREGALILSEKWRMVEKTILRKRLWGPRTLYTPQLCKAVLNEIEKRKSFGANYSNDPPSPPDFSNSINRRLKGGEIEPEAIEALLNVVGSGHYQNLFATAGGKRAKIWEKIYEEVQSKGFEIAGATKREKVTRLFQKWRNMKRSFVKYQVGKFEGRDVKKPAFYEMMFKIISNDVLKMQNSVCDSDTEMKMEEWDEESESEYPSDYYEFSQDHDYGERSGGDVVVSVNPIQLPDNTHNELRSSSTEATKHTVQSSSSKPSASRTSRSFEVLKQIKSLHETSLAMQQQNFSRIISLLENQINQQGKLTAVISDYIMSQTNKSNSKNSQRTENSSQNKTNNGRRSNTLKDENFLS